MDSNGQKRGPEAEDEQLISIGSSSKKSTNVSAEPLICSRNKCVEGNLKNGEVVSNFFSNGLSNINVL